MHTFSDGQLTGSAREETTGAMLPHARRYTCSAIGDGLAFRFAPGLLAGCQWLACDFMLEGDQLVVLSLELSEGDAGPRAEMHFGLLNYCQARARIPLKFVDMNRWMHPREGAYLKPCATGRHVSLEKVDRMTLKVMRIGTKPVTFSLTPIVATVEAPPLVTDPLLPRGVLIDELGQSTQHQWPARSKSVEEVVARLRQQLADAPRQTFPAEFSRWGGWKDGPRLDATGYFRTHHDGARWWLVDPEGHLFWSAGQDCVGPRTEANISNLQSALAWLPDPGGEFSAAFRKRDGADPDHFAFLVANFIRAFGKDHWHDAWSRIVISQLRGWGFNTMANWGEWRIAKAAGLPYVRPLSEKFPSTPCVFRDFPDVFHDNFAADCAVYARQLEETLGDPAMIGYFLMNEPTWGFATETPAEGMLYTSEHSHTRTALAGFLRQKYGEGLAEAWQMPTTLAEIERGHFSRALTSAAHADLAAFSTIMVDRLYRGMSDACKKLDPHHMNLGARYYTVPPDWCLEGMTRFDVFSLNAYAKKIPAEKYNMIASRLKRPVLAGEWHFGALDVGIPASGIGHVKTQADRGRAYRVYVEDAAACPSCVGVHHFQMYDQSALGRFDGENYNIGFVDICGRPYDEMVAAARAAHARLYDVASGKARPFDDAPEYLPLLFI